ncbi:unnamed protein product [Protopolystoma xenopodis]|uniref:Uncharacterized protein n=1 Tax=Protopolystoma xenopodis TaxID=117903 RepID=A0A448WK09_9PLAT|nr:unnamed protein product [Protopolystoma xenopodis]
MCQYISSLYKGGHFSPRTALGIDGYTNSARFDPNEFTVSHDALKRGDSYSGLEINKVCTQKGEDDIDEDLGGEDYDMEEDDDMEDMGEEEDYIPDIEELEAADLARQHQEAEWLRQQQHQQQQILPRGSQFSPLRPTSGYVPLDTHHPRPQQQQHKMQLQQQRQDQSKRQQQNSSLVQPFHRLDTVSGPARPQHARKPIPLATLRSQDEFPTDVSHPFDQHIQLPQHQRQMNPQSSLLSTHSNPVRSKPMRCHFVPANSSASSLELGAVSRQPPRSDDSYLSTQQHQRTVLSTVPPSGGGVFHGDWIETGCTSLMATNAATGFPRGYRVVRSIGPAEILRNAGGVPSVSLGHRERQGTCSMASQESNARDPDLGPSW